MEVKKSVSGFKVRGTWDEVVELGERITHALREVGADDQYLDAFEEWNEWRPKSHERLEDELNQKTAEQAAVDEGEGEKAGEDPGDDVRTAGERLTESYEKLEDDDADGAVDKWEESIDYVARAADSAGRKALRSVENTVYRRVMTQLAPYYFDNELVNANVQQTGDNGEEFVFEVNVSDDDYKEAVDERLRQYDDTVERWHVDTEQETESVEAVEGIEVPEQEPPTESDPSTN